MVAPRRGLPPLNALRAFEAAARHESLKRAADELCVTPSAIGHQVRGLEDYLGVRLFDRKNHSLKLTATGDRFAGRLADGFDILFKAAEAVRRERENRVLTISATPAMALRWLAPKLDRFRRDHPGIEFRIDAASHEVDLAAGEADIDIRYGLTVDQRLQADVLFREPVFPVATLGYLERLNIKSAQDIARATLLQVDDWGARGGIWRCWEEWSTLAGVEGIDPFAGPRFTEVDRAVEAAGRGDGFAMGTTRHLRARESFGPLVQPFAPTLELGYMAYMASLPEVAEEKQVRLFQRWILSTIDEDDPEIIHRGAF